MPDTYISQFSGEEIDAALRAAQIISGADTPAELREKLEIRGDTIPVSATDPTPVSEALTASGGGVNPNLLDNWYFANPINQRGQTEWTTANGYAIDRWKPAGSGKMLLTNDGLKCVDIYAHQFFEKGLIKKGTYTLSVLADDSPNSFTGVLGFWGANADIGYSVKKDNGFATTTIEVPQDHDDYNPFVYLGLNHTFKAAKLELGSTQTLAHKEGDKWVLNEIPDFGEQLRRCQRYALKIEGGKAYGWTYNTNTVNVFIPTPVTMRAVPSLVLDTKHTGSVNTVNGDVAITSIGGVTATSNGVSVDLNNSNSAFTIGTPVVWFGFEGHLTCDL